MNFLRKVVCLLFSLTLLSVGTLVFSSEKNPGEADIKKITFCGHPDYPPVSWTEDDRVIGLAPDLVRKIFNSLGYTVEVKMVGNWKRCLREVALGNVDVVVAYRTLERDKFFQFSQESVIEDPIAVFVNRKNQFIFKMWNDLIDKTGGMMLGDSLGDEFDFYLQGNLGVERVSEGYQLFGMLALEHVDFVPYGLHSGRLKINHLGYQDIIIPLPNLVVTNHFYLAVSKKSDLTDTLKYVDVELNKMHDSGELKRLSEYYARMYSSKQGHNPSVDEMSD